MGSAIGKTLFCTRISPKKTWEGVIGAILLSVITNLILNVFKFEIIPNISYFNMAFVGFIGSSFAVFGDLLESFIKRTANIKDSGEMFPGHGGILDRVIFFNF